MHGHTMGVNGGDTTANTPGTQRYPNFYPDGFGAGSKKATDQVGGGYPHNTMPPFSVAVFIVAI